MTEQEFLAQMAEQGYAKTGHSEYAADMKNDTHTHDFAFCALVLEGEFKLTTEDETITVSPGETWSLEAGVPHAEGVVGNGAVRFV